MLIDVYDYEANGNALKSKIMCMVGTWIQMARCSDWLMMLLRRTSTETIGLKTCLLALVLLDFDFASSILFLLNATYIGSISTLQM